MDIKYEIQFKYQQKHKQQKIISKMAMKFNLVKEYERSLNNENFRQ